MASATVSLTPLRARCSASRPLSSPRRTRGRFRQGGVVGGRPTGWIALVALCIVLCPPALCRVETGPLVFMYGAQSDAAVGRLAGLGLNTAYLVVDDGTDLDALDKTVALARKQGLQVVVGLATTPEFPNAPSLTSDHYRSWVTDLITRAVVRYRADSSVVAWATGDFLEKVMEHGPSEYTRYLKRWYGELADVNAAWATSFTSWNEMAEPAIRAVDQAAPFGVGRASIDVAECRRQAYHDVMAHWVSTIRQLDPARPVMTGRVGTYWALTAVPREYDVICPSVPPGMMEPDLLAHNVHAVDIARHGGRTGVMPCLDVPLQQGGGDLRRWAVLAALHGASGIGLADWDAIQQSVAPTAVLEGLRRSLSDAALAEALTCRPRCSIAFLYEPYAAGFEADGEPAFGLVRGFSEGEPVNPFSAFRVGTCFGLADYITLDDLPLTDLSRYGAVFAPLPVRFPEAAQAQIVEYVSHGGAFVCDLGAGMWETGSWTRLPDALGRLFGIRQLVEMREIARNLSVSWRPSWMPSLLPGATTRGTYKPPVTEGSPDARRLYHVSGPVCSAALDADGRALAVLESSFVEKQRVIAGVIAKETGFGVACFATHRLWANWTTADPVYLGFHRDLCARRAKIELLDQLFLTSLVSATQVEDGVALANAGERSARADVVSNEAGHALHDRCICMFSADVRAPDGRRSGASRLSLDVAPLSLVVCHRTAVQVQPSGGTCLARVVEQTPTRLVVELAGEGAEVRRDQKGRLGMTAGQATDVRVTVRDGVYRVPVGSTHEVRLDTGRGEALEGSFKALSADGFCFSANLRQATLTITQARPGG